MNTSYSLIRRLTMADEVRAIDTVVLAFAADPVVRWCWPNSRQFLSAMPSFVRAFAGNSFVNDGAMATEGYAGVALWLPPGVQPDDGKLAEVMLNTLSGKTRDDAFEVFEQMARFHPTEPHWYLPLVGVDPIHQGNGLGEMLVRHALEQCDRERMPAYLEATSTRNIALYRRLGFEVKGTIQAGSSPPLIPMMRSPQ